MAVNGTAVAQRTPLRGAAATSIYFIVQIRAS